MASTPGSLQKLHAVLTCAAALAACSPEEEPATEHSNYSVRDSAGVTIVESTEPAWGEGEGWALSAEPVLSIGQLDGPEEYMLYRATFTTRLEDGRILVANSGTNQLRFYDGDGAFLYSVGTEGDGPGEFRALGLTFPFGTDSLAIPDYRLFRISIFDRDGGFGRAFRIGDGAGELPFPDGFFGDGTALASVHGRDAPDYSQLGHFRDQVEYRRYDRQGALIDPLTTLPGSETYRGTHPDGSGYTASIRHGLRPWVTVGASSWFYCSSETFDVLELSPEGSLLKILRPARERRPMPQEVFDAREERLREMSPEQAARTRAVPLPEYLPTLEWMQVDRLGNLWMAEYGVLDELPLWTVLDSEGRWLGQVEVPPDGRVTDIGEDYVLGVWRDDLDVETVRMYRLFKP